MATLTCALGPDSAGTVLTEVLRGSRQSIDCAMYEVGPSYAWLFAAAARRGRSVRLVLDDHAADGNRGTARLLAAAGGGCRVLGTGESAFHPKLLVVDGETVAAGTGNLVWRDAPRAPGRRLPPQAPPLRGTREWWLVVRGAPRLARRAGRQVDTAWRLAAAPPATWRAALPEPEAARVGTPHPQVAPLRLHLAGRRVSIAFGSAEVRRVEAAVLASARRRVMVTVPYVRTGSPAVRSLLQAMVAARRRGAEVALLLGAPPGPEVPRLRRLGVEARVMDPRRSTRGHAKGVVVDGTVVVASANWSGPGLGSNWEAALVVRSRAAAGYFAAAFERDWGCAAELEV